MHSLIKRLGKPRSWWVFQAACTTGLLVGGLCVALYFAGLEMAGPIGMLVIGGCWIVAAFSCVTYFTGQLAGRHRELRGKEWAELPW